MKELITAYKSWNNKVGYKNRNILQRNDVFDTVKYTFQFPELCGKNIVFFSDLHIQDENFNFNILIDGINRLEADWIIYGGDLLTLLHYHKLAAKFLSKLKAKDKKFTILGNWEKKRFCWIPLSHWNNFFNSTGFTLLANSSYRTDNIQFIGLIPDTEDFSFIKNNKHIGLTFLLSHKPDDAITLFNKNIMYFNLCLCGHTHGGQIRIPGFGALKTSSKYWKLFEYGHYINPKTHSNLVVSSGLGCTGIKQRLFCRPEIVLIEFK
jgi:uncharacterized protein